MNSSRALQKGGSHDLAGVALAVAITGSACASQHFLFIDGMPAGDGVLVLAAGDRPRIIPIFKSWGIGKGDDVKIFVATPKDSKETNPLHLSCLYGDKRVHRQQLTCPSEREGGFTLTAVVLEAKADLDQELQGVLCFGACSPEDDLGKYLLLHLMPKPMPGKPEKAAGASSTPAPTPPRPVGGT